MPLRPNRSPSAPAENKRPAKTSEYEATTHCSSDVVAPSSRERSGIATLSVVLPTKMISRLRQRTDSVHQRRAWIAAASGDMGVIMADSAR